MQHAQGYILHCWNLGIYQFIIDSCGQFALIAEVASLAHPSHDCSSTRDVTLKGMGKISQYPDNIKICQIAKNVHKIWIR